MKYNKLVRDKIPDIIRANGDEPVTHIATDKEYWRKLVEKLLEEVEEFAKSDNVEELADILEVVYALAAFNNVDKKTLERLRDKKFKDRGGFEEGIILEETKS